ALIILMLSIGFGSVWYRGDCTVPKENFIKTSINNVIKEKYIDKKNHNNETIIFENKRHIILTTILGRKIYKESVIGDSLYKKENSRIIKLYKANGEVIEYEETEPDCEYLLK
ncbi:hypothetical protein CW751_15050, partial [Brumimicrobium salinarum]